MTPHVPNGPEDQALAEVLGHRVCEVRSQWSHEQPAHASSSREQWDEMDEPAKELDRRVGLAIWKDCLAAYAPIIASVVASRLPTSTMQVSTVQASTQTYITVPAKTDSGAEASFGRWRKLPSGVWGVGLPKKVASGSQATIASKSGVTQEITVGRFLSEEFGLWVYALAKADGEEEDGLDTTDSGSDLTNAEQVDIFDTPKPKAKKAAKRGDSHKPATDSYVDDFQDDEALPW